MASFWTASHDFSVRSQPLVDKLISKCIHSPSPPPPPPPHTLVVAASFLNRHRNILQRLIDRLRLEYYRYEVTFGIYVMTPGEKFVSNAFVLFTLSLIFWMLMLYLLRGSPGSGDGASGRARNRV